jgi:iron(III) transport system substrate-binding protein
MLTTARAAQHLAPAARRLTPPAQRLVRPLLLAAPLFCASACKEEAPPKAEVQLATDLPAATAEQILKAVARRGGPIGERIAGLRLDSRALAASGAQAGQAEGAPPAAERATALDAGQSAPAARAERGEDGGTSAHGQAGAGAAHADGGEPGPAEPPPQRPGVTEPVATAASRDGGSSTAAPAAPSGPALAPPSLGGDVRWDVEPYGAIAAAQRGELLPLPASGADVPDLWRDPGGTWVAVGGRARVLLVNNEARAGKGPFRLATLTDPSLRDRVAMAAPVEGAALAHFAALYTAWGEQRMRGWLKALRGNGVQVLANDVEVRLAVVQGRATVGLLASDEAAKAAAIAPVTVIYPDQRTIGTFVWPTALSRPRNAAHPEQAEQLAEQLADKATEQLLVAREPGFIPLRPGIPVPTGVSSAWRLLVLSVEPQQIIANIDQRRAELRAWATSQ